MLLWRQFEMTYKEACEFFAENCNVKLDAKTLMAERPTIQQLEMAVWEASIAKHNELPSKWHDKVMSAKSAIMDYWGSKCIICGELCACYAPEILTGYCEEHCPEHEYEYDPHRRGRFCKTCDKQREYDD